ncbi:MAG: GNAT family N-acetyltransferase [Candidatus Enterenecus sp.]
MTTIYLIRHAQAEGNVYRRCQGWYNSLITPKGYRQIEALEQRFRDTHFDAVYSSDLFRTMTTARAIYRSHGLPLRTDPQLREVGVGCWEDRTWGDLLQQDAKSLLAFWRCRPTWQAPGSETFPSMQNRICSAVERIAAAHPGQTVAVVAHGTVIRSALARWLGLPGDCIDQVPHGDNTCVSKLEYEDGRMRVCFCNDISHLPPELVQKPHKPSKSDEELARDLDRTSLYFRPLDLTRDREFCLSCLRDLPPEVSAAINLDDTDPDGRWTVMRSGSPVGLLLLDTRRPGQPDAGWITCLCLIPEARHCGLGVQLLGQAVSATRPLGRQYLRLNCPSGDGQARCFFQRSGFRGASGDTGSEDTMELYIGYDEQ